MARGEKLSASLEALAEGFIRQADIGGVMYKDASSKEAARKAGELKKQERMYDLGVSLADQAGKDYSAVLEEVIKAEGLGNELPPDLAQRLEDAEIRLNDANAALGAVAPEGSGKQIPSFEGAAMAIINAVPDNTLEDWKVSVSKGEVVKEMNTQIDEYISRVYPSFSGRADIRTQFENTLKETLFAPKPPRSVIGMSEEQLNPGLISQASQGTQRFNPREGSRRETATTPGVAQRVPGTSGVFEGRTTPGPRGIGGSGGARPEVNLQDQAETAEGEATQRYMSQLSPAGQQYWQNFIQRQAMLGSVTARNQLMEEETQLSEEDRLILRQLHASMGI